MIITDHLAARLETAEALDAAACAEAACALEAPGGYVKAVAGGVLTYCGSASPLTHALALGMYGPVAEHDLDEIEDFFRSRDAPVVIDVCPHADVSLRELLVARQYRISEMNNVLVRMLHPGEQFAATGAVEIDKAADAETYSRTVMSGFFGREHISEDELRLGRNLFHMPNSTPLVAYSNGQPAGGCGLSVRNGVASFYGDGVLSEHRRAGVHAAMIAARLRMAVEAQCDLATAGVVPGSASQRNYSRLGFQVAYTKVTMVLA